MQRTRKEVNTQRKPPKVGTKFKTSHATKF